MQQLEQRLGVRLLQRSTRRFAVTDVGMSVHRHAQTMLAEAQAAREIASDFDADELADFLLASWQGAMLRMKVERSAAALERFKTIAFQTVFKELP